MTAERERREPAAVTISHEERGLIHDELLTALSGVGDVFIATEQGEDEDARRLRLRFEDLMRLLDDLGWSPEDPGERFATTLVPERLTRRPVVVKR